MTITYGFYDSISSDRLYNAQQMSSIFDGIIQDGVYAGLGDALMVVEDTGMDVSVGTGRAWFDHTWTYNDAVIPTTIANADAILNRIDVIYLEVNEDVGTRANSISVLEGTPASTPVAPTLTQTGSIHQYPLAHIYIAAAVTEILQDDITNKVGLTETPFVAGIIDYVTTNEILAQWEAEWETWFNSIKDQLDGEAETMLQNQINAIVGDMNPPLIDLLEVKAHTHDGSDTVQIEAAGIAGGAVESSKLATDAVTAGKIADDGVVAGNLATGAVDAAAALASNVVETPKIKNLAVTSAKLAADAVTAGKIADDGVVAGNLAAGAVDALAALANNIVDDTKLGNRVLALIKRKGGSATDWSLQGSTTYTPGAVRMQVGSVMWSGAAADYGSVAVNFPVAFSQIPIAFAITNMGVGYFSCGVVTTATNVTIHWQLIGGGTVTNVYLLWLAIGAE